VLLAEGDVLKYIREEGMTPDDFSPEEYSRMIFEHLTIKPIGRKWYLTINENGRHIQRADINEDNYICNVESNDADARLIASAPDLLKACEKALDEFHEYFNAEVYNENIAPVDTIEQLEIAINKANGEEE
jgi:hypothetical protein